MIIELTLRFTFRQTETPGSCYPAQAAFCKHVQQLDLGDSTGSVCQHDASGPVDSVQKQIDQPGCRKFIWYVFQSQNNQNMKRLKRLWFFSGVSSLVELELSNNFLKSIPISALASLTNLKFLNLGSNKIQVTTNFGGLCPTTIIWFLQRGERIAYWLYLLPWRSRIHMEVSTIKASFPFRNFCAEDFFIHISVKPVAISIQWICIIFQNFKKLSKTGTEI